MQEIIHYIQSQMSWTEFFAALTGMICVYLTIKNNIWCWPWGIVSVVLYGYVFYFSKLYSNMGLQILYYLPMQFFGWWVWLRAGPTKNNDLPISFLSQKARIGWLGVCVIGSVALGYVMSRTDAHLPYCDASLTVISVVAQYLQTYKRFENWILWFAVDVVYAAYLLPSQKLYLSTGLYAIFLIMAVMGMVEWWRIYVKQSLPEPEL